MELITKKYNYHFSNEHELIRKFTEIISRKIKYSVNIRQNKNKLLNCANNLKILYIFDQHFNIFN